MNVTGESEAACPPAQQLHSPVRLGHCCPMQRLKWSFKNAYYIPQGLRGKEYTNQFSLQSKGAVTVEDYWTECQYYDIV